MVRTMALLGMAVALAGCDLLVQKAEERAAAELGNAAQNLSIDLTGDVLNMTGDVKGMALEMLGVPMIAGGEVTNVTVAPTGSGAPTVNLTFTAPLTPDAARAWFTEQFAARQVQVEQAAGVLTGLTRDGANFRIAFDPAGTGTSGRIEIVPPPGQ